MENKPADKELAAKAIAEKVKLKYHTKIFTVANLSPDGTPIPNLDDPEVMEAIEMLRLASIVLTGKDLDFEREFQTVLIIDRFAMAPIQDKPFWDQFNKFTNAERGSLLKEADLFIRNLKAKNEWMYYFPEDLWSRFKKHLKKYLDEMKKQQKRG